MASWSVCWTGSDGSCVDWIHFHNCLGYLVYQVLDRLWADADGNRSLFRPSFGGRFTFSLCLAFGFSLLRCYLSLVCCLAFSCFSFFGFSVSLPFLVHSLASFALSCFGSSRPLALPHSHDRLKPCLSSGLVITNNLLAIWEFFLQLGLSLFSDSVIPSFSWLLFLRNSLGQP